MARVKVLISSAGALAILKSPEVAADVARRTQAVADAANSMYPADDAHDSPGYKAEVTTTDRAHGTVHTNTVHAIRSNAKHNTLLKALSAGKG